MSITKKILLSFASRIVSTVIPESAYLYGKKVLMIDIVQHYLLVYHSYIQKMILITRY